MRNTWGGIPDTEKHQELAKEMKVREEWEQRKIKGQEEWEQRMIKDRGERWLKLRGRRVGRRRRYTMQYRTVQALQRAVCCDLLRRRLANSKYNRIYVSERAVRDLLHQEPYYSFHDEDWDGNE
jgi:hypothetical protein